MKYKYRSTGKNIISNRTDYVLPLHNVLDMAIANKFNLAETLLKTYEGMTMEVNDKWQITDSYKTIVLNTPLKYIDVTLSLDSPKNHDDHEVVTAWAGGKSYKYCRTCKDEIK